MIPEVISVGERMTLRLCRTERFKASTLSLCVTLPILREEAYLTSLLWSVLLRGTRSYPTVAALNCRLDYLFGTELSFRNFYRGDCHIVGLCADILEDAFLPRTQEEGESLLEKALQVIEEILFFPILDADGLLDAGYVESEKRLQCDTIRAQKNHPAAYAADRCRALMYEGEGAGVPLHGSEEEVMAVTPARLTAHWKKLLSTLSLHLFYVGRLSGERIADALERTLGKHLTAPLLPPAALFPCNVHPARGETLYAEESLPLKQGHLVIGLSTGCVLTDPDFYTCVVYNELLGASPVSKLFMNVREKLSLCYSCSSLYNGYKGTVLIRCGLESANRERAEKEIYAQMKAIADGVIDENEWQSAKCTLENAYRQLEDSHDALENYYFGRALAGAELSVAECRAAIAAVRREDVVAFARRVCVDTVFFLRETGGEGAIEDDDE